MTARAGKHGKTPQKTLAGLAASGAPAAGTRGFAFGATNAIASGLSCVSLAMAVAKGRLASLLENSRHRNPIQMSTTGAGSVRRYRTGSADHRIATIDPDVVASIFVGIARHIRDAPMC